MESSILCPIPLKPLLYQGKMEEFELVEESYLD